MRVVGTSLWLGAWGGGVFWRNRGGIENGTEAWESRSVSKEEPGVLGKAQTIQGPRCTWFLPLCLPQSIQHVAKVQDEAWALGWKSTVDNGINNAQPLCLEGHRVG